MPHVVQVVRRLSPPLVVALVALVARLAPVLRGGGLTGILAYDDGVYYSASDALPADGPSRASAASSPRLTSGSSSVVRSA